MTTGLTGSTGLTVTAWEKRVGDTAHFKGKIAWTGVFTGGTFTLNIPRTIDTTKMQETAAARRIDGICVFVDAGVNTYAGIISYNNTTSVLLRLMQDDSGASTSYIGTSTSADTTNPFTFGNDD
jgi:hypothetical protein